MPPLTDVYAVVQVEYTDGDDPEWVHFAVRRVRLLMHAGEVLNLASAQDLIQHAALLNQHAQRLTAAKPKNWASSAFESE